MYPTPHKYNLHKLQRQFMGFCDLILTLYSKRDSLYCIYFGNISQIFGPKHEMFSKPLRTVLFLGILKEDFCRKL